MNKKERIAKIDLRMAQLKARKQRIEASERARKRKMDTQRKILLGAALLTRLQQEDNKAEDLLVWLRGALTEKDRGRLDKLNEDLSS